MQQCYWCYHCLEDFNRIVEDFEGDEDLRDKVAFIKIEGPAIRQFAQRYKVSSYPKFIALQPGTNGDRYSIFGGAKRNYDTLKKWIYDLLDIVKPNKMLAEESQATTYAN